MGRFRAHALLSAFVAMTVAAWWVPAAADTRSQQLYARGLVAFHAQQWEEAYLLFDEATKADDEDALALYYRGLTGARLGFLQESIGNIEHALQLRPELSGAVLDLGILYFEAGQYGLALQWLRHAYEMPEDRFPAALFLGITEYRRGDDAAARKYLAAAAKDPQLRPAANYYEALALLRLGKPEEARQLLKQVQAAQPESEAATVIEEYFAAATEPGRIPAEPEEEPVWSVYGDVSFAYDSNVVLAPDSAAVKESRDISRQQDGRAQLALGGKYRVLDTERVDGVVSLDIYQSANFQLDAFDLGSYRVTLDLVTPPLLLWEKVPTQFGLQGVYDFYTRDFRSFFHEGFGLPWVTFYEGRIAATQLYYRFRGRDYSRNPFTPFRDAYNNAVGFDQYFLLGAVDRVLSFGYQWSDNDPLSRDGTDFAYYRNQLAANVEFEVFDWFNMLLGYAVLLDDYKHPNSRTQFLRRRHDNQHQMVIHLERPLTPYLIAHFDYLGVLNNSNIEEFQYDRSIVMAGVRLHF